MQRPLVGITMGDPLGIGPEVVVKALGDPAIRASARFVIYGDNELLLAAADAARIHPTWFRAGIDHARDDSMALGDFTVIDYALHQGAFGIFGGTREPSKPGGAASKTFVEDAIQDALRPHSDPRRLDAIVTAPISKESWTLAGFRWPHRTLRRENKGEASSDGICFAATQRRARHDARAIDGDSQSPHDRSCA